MHKRHPRSLRWKEKAEIDQTFWLTVHAGSFCVSIIHRTQTWTTGFLPCARDHSYACMYTQGLGTPTASQHNIFDSEKLTFLLCSWRDSNLRPLDLGSCSYFHRILPAARARALHKHHLHRWLNAPDNSVSDEAMSTWFLCSWGRAYAGENKIAQEVFGLLFAFLFSVQWINQFSSRKCCVI